jgi:hypothetical protein
LILSRTLRKRKERKDEMKKLSIFFLFVIVFVFFSVSLVIFAQDKSKKPDNPKADMQERVTALYAEKKAINDLKDEIEKRKTRYDTKCKGKTFFLDVKDQEKIANECKEEFEWLISSSKNLTEKQLKYNKNLVQFKSDMDTPKKAPDTTQGK